MTVKGSFDFTGLIEGKTASTSAVARDEHELQALAVRGSVLDREWLARASVGLS